MKGLRDLELFGCHEITNDGIAEFAKRSHVERLMLTGTNLNDQGLASLAEMQSLRYVVVMGTDVTEEGVAEFRRSRPDVTVFDNEAAELEAEKRELW